MKKILTTSIVVAVAALSMGIANAQGTHPVPDAGSTSALVAVGLAGIAFLRRFVR